MRYPFSEEAVLAFAAIGFSAMAIGSSGEAAEHGLGCGDGPTHAVLNVHPAQEVQVMGVKQRQLAESLL